MLVGNRILCHNPTVVAGGITFVSQASSQSGNGGSISTNWPAASYKRGDLILSAFSSSSTSTQMDVDVGMGPDWTKVIYYPAASRVHVQVWYKFIESPSIITASDTKPFVVWNHPGGGNVSVCGVAQVWRGVDFTQPIDVDPTTAFGSGTSPNSPSLTPITNNALVFSVACANGSDATLTAPAGYSNQVNTNFNDVNPCTVGMASKLLATAAAEDPAAWTNWTAAPWGAVTMALRPARY